jgi:type I restriction enzyme S subunit
VSGATPSTSEPSFWDGDISWATPKDLSALDGIYISDTPRKITDRGLQSCAAAVLPPESVLFSSRAPIGHVAINTTPMATNQGFKSFIPDRDRLDAKYLYYWLRANRRYLEGLGNGATFKEVSKAVVSQIEIPLPPVSEQRRIAAILDKADVLRAKRRAVLKKLEELAQSIFLDMFGDPATNPKGWQLSTIGNVSEKVTDGEHLTPKRRGNGIKLLSARNVRDGAIDMSQTDFIDADEYARISKRCDPRRGDILISCSGTIGRVAPVETDEPFALVRSAAMVRPKLSCVNTRFLDAYLRTPVMKARMLREANASSQANLFQGPIRGLPVFVPPLPFQERFDKRIATVVAVNAKSAEAERALDALFASLQYRAFCGEL